MQQIESVERASPGTAPTGRARGPQPVQEAPVALSLVVPVYNEEESLRPLYEALTAQLTQGGQRYEIIFVDDGSSDASFTVLRALHEQDTHVRVVRFRRNFGKTPALVA